MIISKTVIGIPSFYLLGVVDEKLFFVYSRDEACFVVSYKATFLKYHVDDLFEIIRLSMLFAMRKIR